MGWARSGEVRWVGPEAKWGGRKVETDIWVGLEAQWGGRKVGRTRNGVRQKWTAPYGWGQIGDAHIGRAKRVR